MHTSKRERGTGYVVGKVAALGWVVRVEKAKKGVVEAAIFQLTPQEQTAAARYRMYLAWSNTNHMSGRLHGIGAPQFSTTGVNSCTIPMHFIPTPQECRKTTTRYQRA